jgi:hypothetical protein
MDSHAPFVLRSVAWLNHTNGWGCWLDWAFLVSGLLGVGLALRDRPSGVNALAACMAGAVTGMLSAGASAELASRGLTVPIPAQLHRVGICVEGGHAWLPPVLGARPDLPPNGDYSTFVQTPQRLGFETEVIPRDPTRLAGLNLLVVINPDGEDDLHPVPQAWIEAVRRWVTAGGRLVVLSRSGHIGHEHDRTRPYVEGPDYRALAVPDPGVKVAIATFGSGRILLVSGSELLDTDSLGHCMALPGHREHRRYQTAFAILRAATKDVSFERRTFLPDVDRP